MNKRIDNLIAQATYVSESDDPDYRYESFDKKKFAELIVLECAKIVATAVALREPASTYVSKILELRNEISKAD
jgi:hypothetical protein